MKSFILFIMLAFTAMSFAPAPPGPVNNTFAESFVLADAAFTASVDQVVSPVYLPPEVVVNKYPYGLRQLVALTNAASITIDASNTTLTYATVSVVQATTFNAIVTKALVGDVIYLQVTADNTNRALTFTGNMVGATYTVTASKEVLLEFVYNGSKFINASVIQVN